MNLANLERTKPTNSTAIVRLWGSYDDEKHIEDPYYGGIVSFGSADKRMTLTGSLGWF